jgi:hypothetical protein
MEAVFRPDGPLMFFIRFMFSCQNSPHVFLSKARLRR